MGRTNTRLTRFELAFIVSLSPSLSSSLPLSLPLYNSSLFFFLLITLVFSLIGKGFIKMFVTLPAQQVPIIL